MKILINIKIYIIEFIIQKYFNKIIEYIKLNQYKIIWNNILKIIKINWLNNLNIKTLNIK